MLALDDITVVSLESGVSAPLCTRLLGDFRAEADVVQNCSPGVVERLKEGTDEVLETSGYSSEEIEQLRADDVVRAATLQGDIGDIRGATGRTTRVVPREGRSTATTFVMNARSFGHAANVTDPI